MMNIPVRSRCHRILKDMKNYHSLLPDTEYFDKEYSKKTYPIELDDNEYIVGVYENKFGERIFDTIPQDIMIDNIVITSSALHLCKEKESTKIFFKDITHTHTPENKIDDLVITVYLKDKIIKIPILYTHGLNGKFKDAFKFVRFLDGVSRDSKEE